MAEFRGNPLKSIAGIGVSSIEDYNSGTRQLADGTVENLTLPKADVVKYILEDGSWVCIRPSGTEPKCKVYFGVRKETNEEAKVALGALMDDVMGKLEISSNLV